LYFILFNLHTSAASIPLLAPREVMIDLCDVNGYSCGNTFNNGCQRRAMRLTCGKETEHGYFILLFVYGLFASAVLPLVETETLSFFQSGAAQTP
jgi:hypothetical protein